MLYLDKNKLHDQEPNTPQKQGKHIDWAGHFAAQAEQAKHPLLQKFYQAGAVSLETPIDEVELVAMDFETTGLNAEEDEIISIGLVPMNLQRIRTSRSRYWVVKPRAELKESVTIHGITDSEINEADDISTIFADLLDQLERKVVVVHYRQVERRFLDAALRKRLGEGIDFPVIDTMELETRLHKTPRQTWWRRLLRIKQQPVSLRLAQSRSRYHLPYYHPHQALTDALACAELFQAQISTHFSADTPIETLWS